jgi:hypothetical protein
MYGDIAQAIETTFAFHVLWKQHKVTPEKVNLLTGKPLEGQDGYY